MSGIRRDPETGFFMHLFLDAEMSGSPLQGHHFDFVSTKLNSFLEKIKDEKITEAYILALLSAAPSPPSASPSLPPPVSIVPDLDSESKTILPLAEVEAFIKQVGFLGWCAQELKKANSKEDLSSCATKIFEQLCSQGYVDFPGGYAHGGGGHAMVYRLMVDKKNKRLLFLVLNSGDGLSYHQTTVNPKLTKTLYENVVAYQIPFDKLPYTAISELKASSEEEKEWRFQTIGFITELLHAKAPRVPGGPLNANAQYLYENLFEKIRFLGGKPCDTSDLKSMQVKPRFITEQRSGSCTQKALNQLQKEHFLNKKAALRFAFAYRLDYLPQYITYLKSKGLDQDPEHRQYVVMAARNLSRILVEDLDKLSLDPAHAKAIQEYLASVLVEFTPVVEAKPSPAPSLRPPPSTPIRFRHSTASFERDVRRQAHNSLPSAPKGPDLAASLEAIFRTASVDRVESIKRLCMQFLPKLLAESVEAKEAKGISAASKAGEARSDGLVSVIPLVQNLLLAVKGFNGQLSPQSAPMYFALMLAGLRELDKPELRLSGSEGIPALDLFAPLFLEYLRLLKKSPYLASYDPEFDRLWKDMEVYLLSRVHKAYSSFTYIEGLPSITEIEKHLIQYYAQIIDQHSELAKELRKKYQEISDEEFNQRLEKLRGPSDKPLEFDRKEYVKRRPGSETLLAYWILLDDAERGPTGAYYPLTKALDQAKQYEEFIQEGFAGINPNIASAELGHDPQRRKPAPAPSLKWNYSKTNFWITSPAIGFREIFDSPRVKAAILSSHRPLDSDFKQALEYTWTQAARWGAGQDLLETPTRSCSEVQFHTDDALARDAQYNRRAESCQLENVLGYYQLYPSLLREEKHQTYFSLCLFQPGLLLEKLSLHESHGDKQGLIFLKAFASFFQFSFAYHDQTQRGKMSEAQVFLLQLATQLYSYALDPSFPPSVRALAYQQLMETEKTLQLCLFKFAPRDNTLGFKLRKIQALLLIRKEAAGLKEQDTKKEAKEKKEVKEEQDKKEQLASQPAASLIERLLQLKIESAQCMGGMAEEVKESAAEKEFAEHLNAQIHDYFIASPEEVLKCLPALVAQSYPELKLSFVKAEAVEGQPLLYRLIPEGSASAPASSPPKEYRIDLASGFLIIDDCYKKPLPAAIRSHEYYTQVIGEEVSSWFDQRDSFYYFEHQGKKYRVANLNPPILQMQIKDEWFSLSPTRPGSFNYRTPLDFFDAPPLYQQSRYRWWFKGNQAYIYDCERSYFAYQCSANSQVSALDSQEPFKVLGEVECKLDSQLLAPFLAVESAEFIEVVNIGAGYRVNLPRYGQVFEVSVSPKGKSEAICKIDGKKFKLVQDAKLDFCGFPAYLVLEPSEEKAEDKKAASPKTQAPVKPKRVVRVPWQAFRVETDESGFLKPKKTEGLHFKLIQDHQHFLKKSVFEKDDPPHQHWWHYNRTEKMVDFSLSEEGELTAQSPEDQLYLVYIYLTHRRPDLADKLLREIQLTGSAEELENAYLILTQLPAGEEEQLNTPANLAVQNRLLFMLADLGNRSKKPIQIPVPKTLNSSDSNVAYAQRHRKQLLSFYESLGSLIAEKYSLYLNTLNNIDARYRLDFTEEHQLLSYYVMGHRCLMRPSQGFQPSAEEAAALDEAKLKKAEQKARDALCVEACLSQALTDSKEKEEKFDQAPSLDSLLLARWAAMQNHMIQHVRSSSQEGEGKELKVDEIAPELKTAFPISGKVLVLRDKNLKIYLKDDDKDNEDSRVKMLSTISISITQSTGNKVLAAWAAGSLSPPAPPLSLALTEEELKKYLASYYQHLLDDPGFRTSTQAFCERALAHCAVLAEKDSERHKLPYFHFLLAVARTPQQFKSLAHYKLVDAEEQKRHEAEQDRKQAEHDKQEKEREQKLIASGKTYYRDRFYRQSYSAKDPDGRVAIAAAWRAYNTSEADAAIVIPAIRQLQDRVMPIEAKVALPKLSHHSSLEKKDYKLASPPIATDDPHLEKIRRYKEACEQKVKAIKEHPLPEFKHVSEGLRYEKALEDEVALAISHYNELIDEEISHFFAGEKTGFTKLLKDAKAELKNKEAESKALKEKLHADFFKAKLLDALLKEMGGVSPEIDAHSMLLLARLVEKEDQETLEKFPILKEKQKKKEFLDAVHAYLNACFAQAWLKKICDSATDDLASQRALVKYLLDYNVSTRFETHILQYVDNIAVYPEQQAHLDAVLNLPTDSKSKGIGSTVHLPMGAGKTALIIPSLAAKMADGKRLVVVQVPSPLLLSVFANLSKTSKRAYRQQVALMEFDRDSDTSPLALYRHYCLLVNSIAQRGYIMLSKATRDAFDAKLQELLAYADAEIRAGRRLDQYAQQQIHYLSEINALFEGAYNITDEGHEASRIKDEMRYTFGKKIHITTAQIRDLQLFFDRFFKIKYDGEHSFFNLIQRNSGLTPPNPEKLKEIMAFFVEKELLPECFPGKSKVAYEKIKAFLFNSDDSDPKSIESFFSKPEEYSRVLLYRELCQNFVSYALDRRLFVNYGPAEEDDPRAQLGLTVYFKYNNVRSPNQFSHYLETAVLTIFMVYGLGIDRFTFDRLMRRFHERHGIERIQLALKGKFNERTETEKLFKRLFGFELETVNFEDPTAMAQAFDKVRFNPEVITIALRDEILPKVDTYDEELFKDSITHAYRYRDRILLSGTLRSYKTFDHKVEHQPAKTLAVNGLIRKTINDNAQVAVLRKMPAQDYINALMEIDQPGELTAIIDVGAHLEGICNQEVARYIAEKLREQGRTDKIEYVLFCDNGQWCALSTHDLAKAPIRLNGTTEEELSEKLGPVGCRFTFFDQARCEGADIRQPLPKDTLPPKGDLKITTPVVARSKQKIPPASRAIVTVEKDTTESAYQQGCYRMRGLANGQVLTVVVHEELAEKMQAAAQSAREAKEHKEGDSKAKPREKKITSPALILQPKDVADFTFETELKGLIPDHKHAARFRMFNALREDLAKRIKQVPDKGKWPLYFGHFRQFFIRSQSLSAIELFASKWKKMPLWELLLEEACDLLSDWQKVIKEAGIALSDAEIQAMEKQLQDFIVQALEDCEPEALHTSKRALGTETQVQMEQQKQKQKEVKSEVQARNPDYQPIRLYTDWVEEYLRRSWRKSSSVQHNIYVRPYQENLDKEVKGNGLALSPNIHATYNYYMTCNVSKSSTTQVPFSYGRYTKPIQNLLFLDTEPLSVIILTPEETEAFKAQWHLYKPHDGQSLLWLQEISGIPIAGARPDGMTERPDYQSLMEQLWFLNGNLDRLMLEKELHWLSDSPKEKIAFYKQHISKAHRASDIEPLEERLLQSLTLYREVQERIIKLGFTRAACEKPESLDEEPFSQYLSAMQEVWAAFATGKPEELEKLKQANWSLKYNKLTLQTVGLIKEYEQHLERMEKLFHLQDVQLRIAGDSQTVSLKTLLDHIDLWLYPYPASEAKKEKSGGIEEKKISQEEAKAEIEEKTKRAKPLRFAEICLRRLIDVPAYDAAALTLFIQELPAAGTQPLSNLDKLRYVLRLLACVQNKTRLIHLLDYSKVAPLLAEFYNDTEVFTDFYHTFQDCSLASMDFLNTPPYSNNEADNFYSILKVLAKIPQAKVGTLPNPTVLKKLLDAGLSHPQIVCFARAYANTAALPASIVIAPDVADIKTYFGFPPVQNLINNQTDLPQQQVTDGLTQYLVLKAALKKEELPPESKDMQAQYDCARLIRNPKEQEFFLLSLVCQYTEDAQDKICAEFSKLYSTPPTEDAKTSAIEPTPLPLLMQGLAALNELCSLITVGEQTILLNLPIAEQRLAQLLATLDKSSGVEFTTHCLPFLEADSHLQRKLLADPYKKNPWIGFYARIKDFKEQPKDKVSLFSLCNTQRVAELVTLPDAKLHFVLHNLEQILPLLAASKVGDGKQEKILALLIQLSHCADSLGQEVIAICLPPTPKVSILSPSLAKNPVALATARELCDLLGLPQPQQAPEKSPESKHSKPAASRKKSPDLKAPSLEKSPPSSAAGSYAAVSEGLAADSSGSSSFPPITASLPATSSVPRRDTEPPQDELTVTPPQPAIALEKSKEKAIEQVEKLKPSTRHAWLQILLALLCASTAAALLYVLVPLLPLLIATTLSTMHILPIIIGVAALTLACLALYLGFQGTRNLIQPPQPQDTVHDLPYTSFSLGLGLGIISLLSGMAICVLSIYGVILFPAMPLLLTILATATPICLGLYLLVRIHNVFDPVISPSKFAYSGDKPNPNAASNLEQATEQVRSTARASAAFPPLGSRGQAAGRRREGNGTTMRE